MNFNLKLLVSAAIYGLPLFDPANFCQLRSIGDQLYRIWKLHFLLMSCDKPLLFVKAIILEVT